jgi:hypothetical protein
MDSSAGRRSINLASGYIDLIQVLFPTPRGPNRKNEYFWSFKHLVYITLIIAVKFRVVNAI